MIVDDSALARSVLARIVGQDPQLHLVAEAGTAAEAIELLAHARPDILILDIEMPGQTGLQALPEILSKGRGARVLILSSACETGAEATVQALALGAADTLPKPGAGTFNGQFAEVLKERLRKIGRIERPAPTASANFSADGARANLRALPGERIRCLALGASTGGLSALSEFLVALPPRIGVPILVTQHLPHAFMSQLAKQLEAASGRSARVAHDEDVLEPDQILVAPGYAHLGLGWSGGRIRVKLSASPASSNCMPSVDTMLSSVAEIFGRSASAVIFSGMGRDGLVGSGRLVDRGGTIFVQDQESAAIWGMPRVIADAGLASAIDRPAELARRIGLIVGGQV